MLYSMQEMQAAVQQNDFCKNWKNEVGFHRGYPDRLDISEIMVKTDFVRVDQVGPQQNLSFKDLGF